METCKVRTYQTTCQRPVLWPIKGRLGEQVPETGSVESFINNVNSAGRYTFYAADVARCILFLFPVAAQKTSICNIQLSLPLSLSLFLFIYILCVCVCMCVLISYHDSMKVSPLPWSVNPTRPKDACSK